MDIIATFKDKKTSKKYYDLIDDFINSRNDEKYKSFEEYSNYWTNKFNGWKHIFRFSMITDDDFNLTYHNANAPTVELYNETIEIFDINTPNVGGIIKLLVFLGVINITIENDMNYSSDFKNE